MKAQGFDPETGQRREYDLTSDELQPPAPPESGTMLRTLLDRELERSSPPGSSTGVEVPAKISKGQASAILSMKLDAKRQPRRSR